MKITFLSPPPNLSGGQRVVAVHADQLLARGHEVTVVVRRRDVPSFPRKLRHVVSGRKIPATPQETHFDRMKAKLVVVPHTGPINADDVPDADVVIATWWETAFEVVHFPPSKGQKFYFVQHHEVHSHIPWHLSAASYVLSLKKIAISSWLVDTMRDSYGDDDVALVPNAVDHSLFYAAERSRQPEPTVGIMYSATPFKGFDIALRSIEIAREAHPDLRVIAFGASSPSSRWPLPKGTTFHLNPPQDRLREIYASCDAFIAASRSEGFGLPILEAMACRTPVVATRTGCAKDVIEDGTSGYVVDVEDPDALGERLARVLSMDPGSWRVMSEKAYKKTIEYTWNDAGALFENALVRHLAGRQISATCGS